MKTDQLSQTAAFVAIKFYGMTRDDTYGSLFDDAVIEFYDRLVASLPKPFCYYHYWLTFGWVRKFYIWSEELLLPGDLLHVIARKWYIQRLTRELLDQGYSQIIVLGAGFDHLTYYYAQQGVACFEFDAPRMANLKRQFLIDHFPNKIQPEIITSYLPTDKPGKQFSKHPEIDPQKKTVVVAEGFFDYLEPDTVDQTIQSVRNYFSHNPALISTHFALEELPAFHQKVFKRSVQLVGEELRFRTPMTGFKQMLEEQGFSICQLHDSQEISTELHKHANTSLPVLKGFYVLKAK